MGETHLKLMLTISCLCLLWISGLASLPSRYSLGIDPKDLSYYKSNVIKCKDGSRKFRIEELNDDFCDCPDGTDEPGTSACPEGRFYCKNAGHIPLTIFSSRVNDGICDCCDGSDEYKGLVNCSNTCWEAGNEAREKLKKKIKTYQEGVTIRMKEVEKGKQAFAKDQEDLSKLKSEEKIFKDLVDKLKEHKERIEKAEEEERLKKEKEEKRLKEAEREAKEQEELTAKGPNNPTDGVHEESPKQDVSKEGHYTAGETSKDHSVEAELSASHAVEQDVSKEGHYTAGETAKDHSVEAELSSGHAVEQHVAEDQGDTYKPDNADHSRSDEESPSDIAKQNVGKDHGNSLLEDESDDDGNENDEGDSSRVKAQEQGGSDDTSGLSKDELGRLVASRWTGESTAHKSDETGSTVKDEVHQDSPNSAEEEYDDNGYTSEIEDDRHKYDDDSHKYDDDDDFGDDADEEYADNHVESDDSYNPDGDDKHDYSDMTDTSSSSWLIKIKQTVHNVLSSFNFFKTPVDLSEADRVKKEYDDSKSKLSKIQSKVSILSEKLKHDFGKEKEFYSFYDRCFENKQNKYIYKVCPFKQASQDEGHSSTRLGSWEKFDGSYRVMQFSHGDKCWNGPDRSLNVRLRCGLTNELTDVDEPSRCEYVAVLSTPALCAEDKLKELQQKLEQMNTRRPNHDEL